MIRPLFIFTLIILGISACKEDCKTCPDGFGLINDECKCIGYLSGEKCYTLENLTAPLPLSGNVYYSFDVNSSENFNFNTQPQLIAIGNWGELGTNSETTSISLIQSRNAALHDIYKTTLQRQKGLDSAWFQPFGIEKGFQKGSGSTASNMVKTINGQTCYLRPYLVQLDSELYRIRLKWETENGEVIDVCTKIFRR